MYESFDDWVKRLKRKKRLKKGSYLHFDLRGRDDDQISKLRSLILNNQVSSHPFLPFIKSSISFPKYKYSDTKKKRLIENKVRGICYASHFDSILYSYYSNKIGEGYEKYLLENNLGKNVIAYRSIDKKCNIHFAKEVFEFIYKKRNCVAIALDIRGFFDELDHDYLKNNLISLIGEDILPRDIYHIYRSICKFSWVEKEEIQKALGFRKNDLANLARFCDIETFRKKIRKLGLIKQNENKFGIPQGTPISALFSNIYLKEFDKEINNYIKSKGGLYRRYSDDIMLVVNLEDHEKAKNIVYDKIKEAKLVIKKEKEHQVFFNYNNDIIATDEYGNHRMLQYLGFEYNGNSIYIRSSSISKYHRRMRTGVNEYVKKVNSKNLKTGTISKKRLYNRYTHRGKRNFVKYAQRSSKIMKDISIRKQVSNNVSKLKDTIDFIVVKKRDEN